MLRTSIDLGVTSAKAAQSLLREALAVAPDDAARSRAQGVLTHITASLDSALQASQATTLAVARSQVDAARGEAVEALDELEPFAATLLPAAPPPSLPVTGGPPVGLLASLGLVALTLGLGLRRGRFA